MNRRLQFYKRDEHFSGVHNEMLSTAMALYHEETVQQTARERARIHGDLPWRGVYDQHGVESRLSGTGSVLAVAAYKFLLKQGMRAG